MKTIIKIIITAIVCLAIGWYASLILNKAKEKLVKTPLAQIKEKEIQTEAEKITDEVKKNGLQHTIFKMVKEVDKSEVDAVKADLLDTTEALGIARDKIKQVMVINTNLTITNRALQKKVSQLATTYSHFDDHFRLSVNVPNDTTQVATFDAGYDADLITTQYNKTRWLFWNDPYIDIYSNDPRFTIKGARTLTISPKQSAFGLSGDAVASYNDITGPGAGAGIKVRIGKLTINGSYRYYPDYNRWSPDYGVRFRIIGSE